MGEYVHIWPSQQVQLHPFRQERKTGAGDFRAPLPGQHFVQPVPQGM